MEKLAEQEKLEISREKVRQILRAAGIASPRKRRGNKHRSRRERKAAEGMMLQVDGSPHDWLEGMGRSLCLIGLSIPYGQDGGSNVCRSGEFLCLLPSILRDFAIDRVSLFP